MQSLNKVLLIGRLGKAPKTEPAGEATVTRLSIAVNATWKDRDGNPQDRTDWFDVSAWNGIGEAAAKYLRAGSLILVEGSLRSSSWEDKTTKEKRYKTEIVASNIVFLDKKPVEEPEAPKKSRTRREQSRSPQT